MIRKLPIVNSSANIPDIICAIAGAHDKNAEIEFRNMLSVVSGTHNICLTDSGIAAFYCILKALSQNTSRREVILPAYTAGSLIVAVRKAGLIPVLCDISLDDFNMDISAISAHVSEKTLAVVAVHMFGIGMCALERVRAELPKDIYMIEDCCQSMGSTIGGHSVGTFGDISFYSFNRGKNLSLGGGGFISTDNVTVAQGVESIMASYKDLPRLCELIAFFRMLAIALATNRITYGLGYSIISRFKETMPPKDFTVGSLTDFQTALGIRLLKRIEALSVKRYNNGAYIIKSLKGLTSLMVPKLTDGTRPAFNRLPILFRDVDVLKRAEDALGKNGIETSRMYLQPLHHMFDLGYDRKLFPNANYLAGHLLALPVHPAVKKRELDRMIAIVKGVVQ